jgi:hypothetical protein
MAKLVLDDSKISVVMSRLERLGAFHRDVVVARPAIVAVAATAQPWSVLAGVRAPGTGLPRVIMLGTMRHHGEKTFCAIYGTGPAVVVTTTDPAFQRLIVSCADAAAVATTLREDLGLS